LHFLSQVLRYLTNSSSVFPLVAISSSGSEILSSVCSILLEWPSILFCISVSFFFSEVFHIVSYLLFNIVNFCPLFLYLSVYGGLSFSLAFFLGLLLFHLFVSGFSHILCFYSLGTT
jgi:hypothetical protein